MAASDDQNDRSSDNDDDDDNDEEDVDMGASNAQTADAAAAAAASGPGEIEGSTLEQRLLQEEIRDVEAAVVKKRAELAKVTVAVLKVGDDRERFTKSDRIFRSGKKSLCASFWQILN